MNDLLNPRIANIRYAATVMIILAGVLICVFLSVYQAVDNKTSDMNYNVTVSLNGYLIKAANAEYDSEAKLFEFDLYHKSKSEVKASTPEIYSIASSDDLNTFRKYTAEPIKNNEYGIHYSVADVPAEAEYVRIFLSSTTPSYTLPDKTDDFGNVIKGETVAEATQYVEIVIDMKSVNQEKISPEGIISDIDKNFSSESSTTSQTTLQSSVTYTSTAVSESTTSAASASSVSSTTTIESSHTTTVSGSHTTTVAESHTTAAVTTSSMTTTTSKQTTTTKHTTAKTETTSAKKTTTTAAVSSSTTTAATTRPPVTTTAQHIPLRGLKIDCAQAVNGVVTLPQGSSAALTAVFTPENASAKVSWSSTDSSVAVVDATGKVTAVSKGTCIIKCTSTGEELFEVGIMIKVQ